MVSSRGRNRKNRYHHGDLRPALVAAGVRLVEKHGVEALKLRAVARDVGVSHMAPYNHFADRAALVAAVAAEGYRRLSSSINERMAPFGVRPALQLQEAGIAYVGFAAENPGLFRLMFSPEVADKSGHPELQDAARRTLDILSQAIARSAGSATPTAAASGIVPLVAWSFVHGLAVLLLDEQFGPRAGAKAAEDLARAATEVLWTGLRSV